MKTNLVDKLLKRKWTPALIEKYMGRFQSCWLSYAMDEEIRQNAASGGTITGLLAYLLDSGKIDGALVCATHVEGNEVKAEYKIATTRADLIAAQGSKYVETHFSHDAVPLIKEFPGKLALVLLPCDTWIVNRLRQNHPEIDQKIRLTIALFCGHISDPGLTRLVIRKNKPAGVSLTSFRYRIGHWRGKLRFGFEDETQKEKAFSAFSDYQNLYFFCARKCLHCHDHTGYDCDLSVGDVWLMSMKDNPIKHNAIIARTQQAEADLQAAYTAKMVYIQSVPSELVADAQSRSLPMHYNVSARASAGKLLGLKVSDPVHERVRLIDFLIAIVILFNYRLTTTPRGRLLVGSVPKQLIKLYLYALKALEIL
jgi:coenzyme F420-reducing hydrogenase beta subunit